MKSKQNTKEKEPTDGDNALRVLTWAMLVGALGVFVYAAQVGGKDDFFAIASVGILLAGASAFIGGSLGFLFGIPRTLQHEDKNTSGDPNSPSSEAGAVDAGSKLTICAG